MNIKKGKEQEIKFDDEGNAYVMHGKKQIGLDQFYRETVRFIDDKREYWHGMDCTRDLVIHLSNDGETAILGRIYE